VILSGLVCQQVVVNNDDSPNVTIEGLGPSHADLNERFAQALKLCQFRDLFNGTRHRLLNSGPKYKDVIVLLPRTGSIRVGAFGNTPSPGRKGLSVDIGPGLSALLKCHVSYSTLRS
jgi:hypothetical protein